MLSHHFAGVIFSTLQRCINVKDVVLDSNTPSVPYGNRNIPQPTFMPNPANRAALSELQKIVFRPSKQGAELLPTQSGAFVKIR
jgi:hypothetical protein